MQGIKSRQAGRRFGHCKVHLGLAALILLISAGCRTGQNYTSLEGPRYRAGTPVDAPHQAYHGDTLIIVTFNIENGVRVDSALVMLQTTTELRDPDIVLLQEVDEPGTRRIAATLKMGYVYYPASFRNNIKRDWGNAVLTRWPIADDRKLVLPHIGRWGKTLRAATAATIRVRGMPVRVYSTHLGTFWNVGGGGRRDQLRAILADAERFDRAILGGDMNSGSVGNVAVEAGFAWPTAQIAKTAVGGRIDHIFLKGLAVPGQNGAATVPDNHHASDHKAVWARAILTNSGY